jgi:sugar-specific transcriptional regulator TrmB
MLFDQELVSRVKEYFNLNLYETRIWLSLLAKGIASAGEISSISGVPRPRVYDILESLEKKGFVMMKLGKPVKYMAIKPQVVLERVKSNIINEAEDRVRKISKITETEEFKKIEKIYQGSLIPTNSENLFSYIKGKSNISYQLKDMIKKASKKVIICENVDDVFKKVYALKNLINYVNSKNVEIIIGLYGDEKKIKKIQENIDVKIRRVNSDSRFFVIDDKEVLFYISKNKEKNNEEAIFLNSEFFAKLFSFAIEKNEVKRSLSKRQKNL